MELSKKRVMTKVDEYIYLFLITLGLYFTILFGVWWFWPTNIPHNFSGYLHVFDFLLFVALSYLIWHQIILELFSWFIAFKMREPVRLPPEQGMSVAFLTAFVPSKEPYEVLEKTLKAMIAVDYPHDTWVLDEGNDEVVKTLCKKYGAKHFSRHGKTKYNQPMGRYKAKTKGGNYNAWFDNHGIHYHYVAQIDVDFIPQKNFLTDTIGYFRDPDVAFVGTPQIYGNQSASWIARGAAEQAFSFYGHMQKGLFGFDMSLFIGANHILRSVAHDDIDGYSGHIVEDHLTGMNIYRKKWKSVYVPQILASGEGPHTWEAYFSQQMRWAYGLIHILFHESFGIFGEMKKIHIFNYFLLQQFYFYGIAQVVGLFLLTLYFVFGIEATKLDIEPLVYLYVPMLSVQLLISSWLLRYCVDPENEIGLNLRGRLLSLSVWPIYFLAFFGVITGKRLTYKVTPKGVSQASSLTPLSVFKPHLIMGSISLFDIFVSFFTHHQAPQLLFFAFLNTAGMLGFVLPILKERVWATD